MTQSDRLAAEILDKALELAAHTSWEKLCLHDIAADLGISLDDIRLHFPQKDDLVEAWFDRADSAMLQFAHSEDMTSLSVRARLTAIIMSWLDALAVHRSISGDMLLYKLEPGHVHLQVLGVLRISRTVQWFREASRLDTTQLFRIAEEIGLTSIFLATFSYWLLDTSANSKNTRHFLDTRLKHAEYIVHNLLWFLPGASSNSDKTVNNPEA